MVISPGTSAAVCESFGNRLREAIRAANISVHGQRLSLSVSVGIANSPVDAVVSAGALIELAGERLKEAQQRGGNRVISSDSGVSGSPVPALRLEHAVELLRSGNEQDVVPHLGSLARELLPLLRLMDRELGVGIPLAAIEQHADMAGGDLLKID